MRKRRRVGGFTLVELMIVIAIIAILASIAIPQYLKYQRKAKVSSYAMPVVRGCAMDIATYCMENPNGTIPNLGDAKIPNCKNTVSTPVGDVTIAGDAFGKNCNLDGSVPDNSQANGTLTNVEYAARCEFTNNGSMQCSVVGI